jgi:hypothetical protein
MSSPPLPGDHVRWFANKVGWPLKPGVNVIVEGEHDARYFRLADKLYRRGTGRQLLGDAFHVLSAGTGDAAGTDGIVDHFVTIHKNAKIDCSPLDQLPVFRLAALLDDDWAGRDAANFLTASRTGCLRWRDVFLLQRRYPLDTREVKQIDRRVKELNVDWKSHDCEIEDLLPKPLIDLFEETHPKCFARDPVERAERWHFEFAFATKGALCTHVEDTAILEDVNEIIYVLKALRFFLAAKPVEGTALPVT